VTSPRSWVLSDERLEADASHVEARINLGRLLHLAAAILFTWAASAQDTESGWRWRWRLASSA
jgi:hypothetical protein